MSRRRAIPRLLAFALLGYGLFPLEMVMDTLDAAPVPAAPKADDAVSASATKLLQHRKIQKELKMSAEQRIVILDGLADIEEEHEKKVIELSRMPNPNEECYDKLDKERRKQTDKLLADAVTKGLSAQQRTRLQQLDLWLHGPTAFTDPKVEKKLALTDAQKKKAKEVAERMKGQLDRFLNGDTEDDEAKRRADLFKFRAERLKEMEGALTADQKTAWATMLGTAPTGFVVEELWLKIEEELDLQTPTGG